MGSLMAGWSSPIMDQHKARARRNNSLTKEEINHFWKSNKKVGDEEGDMSFSPHGSPSKSPMFLNDEEKRKAASPFSRSYKESWLTNRPESVSNSPRGAESLEEQKPERPDKPDKTGDWWTRSNWAFLNEPPRVEVSDAKQKYTAQFNVAELAAGTA